MRILLVSLFLLFSTFIYSQYPVLKFNDNSKFKIVQFTDVHYQKENPASAVALELIEEVLRVEKPDLVVFTGDIIFSKPAKEGLDDVFNIVEQNEVPWAYVFGNHDDEYDMSRQEIMDFVQQKTYTLARPGDKYLKGVGNYVLEVKSANGEENKSVLYFFDSGAYAPIKGVGTYDWLGTDQVEWYARQSAAYTKDNNGHPLPALAFFHIPLAEYSVMKSENYDKLIGSRDEKECHGRLNTGMFAAMRQAGDVMGTFVGHDHNNDYIGNYYDIYLAYGRFSGGNTVYNDLGKNGCRVIELTENKREFSTYIRLLGGEKLYPVEYPKTLSVKK
ncbi:metallophosphoesterase family protein [Prevotella sp. 10(H)]|uniref:metallophosphoesterase family protein n=1 Tax=Prevotella sp. 10(H) TaxID=1158294 RepID=UPI0004A76536|nr:metallophosphoesterase family protein [Prevotella sp. 10(H)]